jgi:hypothetical protein
MEGLKALLEAGTNPLIKVHSYATLLCESRVQRFKAMRSKPVPEKKPNRFWMGGFGSSGGVSSGKILVEAAQKVARRVPGNKTLADGKTALGVASG